jgi:hypothetical protein
MAGLQFYDLGFLISDLGSRRGWVCVLMDTIPEVVANFNQKVWGKWVAQRRGVGEKRAREWARMGCGGFGRGGFVARFLRNPDDLDELHAARNEAASLVYVARENASFGETRPHIN